MEYALKLSIADILAADQRQIETWVNFLREHVNRAMAEDNANHTGDAVGNAQIRSWFDCFTFIRSNLSNVSEDLMAYPFRKCLYQMYLTLPQRVNAIDMVLLICH